MTAVYGLFSRNVVLYNLDYYIDIGRNVHMDRLKVIVKALDDKRAENIDVLNISELTSLGDYFVICSCNSNVQVRACVDEVEEKMKENGFEPMHKEGYRGGSWVVLDFDDIIVHVMDKETREFYALERLWDDAPRLEIDIED